MHGVALDHTMMTLMAESATITILATTTEALAIPAQATEALATEAHIEAQAPATACSIEKK